MNDQRTTYLPDEDAVSALLREAQIDPVEADPKHYEDGITRLLEEVGLHKDQPLAVSRKTAAGQWPPHSPVTGPR